MIIFIVDSWPTTPQKVIVPGSVTSASVQNLQPATSYHLRIIAENRLGQSEPSQLVQVTTTEEGRFISVKRRHAFIMKGKIKLVGYMYIYPSNNIFPFLA